MRVMITRGAVVALTQNCSTTLSRGEVQDFYIRISACSPPASFTVSGGGTICSSSSTSIALGGSASTVSYALYRNAIATGTTLTGTGSALNFTGIVTAGTYTVVATNLSGCTATMSGSAAVNVVPLPTTSAAGSDQTVCGATITNLAANTPFTPPPCIERIRRLIRGLPHGR